jgi:hypothetical protein
MVVPLNTLTSQNYKIHNADFTWYEFKMWEKMQSWRNLRAHSTLNASVAPGNRRKHTEANQADVRKRKIGGWYTTHRLLLTITIPEVS